MLHWTCIAGDLDQVKVLVEAGAEYKNAVNWDGESAPFVAASHGKMETAQWLRSQGAQWLSSYEPALAAQLALVNTWEEPTESDVSWLQSEVAEQGQLRRFNSCRIKKLGILREFLQNVKF